MSNFFAIGIMHAKTSDNIGTLFRSALNFGAAYIYTVNRRYSRQSSDTQNTAATLPLFHYESVSELKQHLPHDCRLVGIDCNVPNRVVENLDVYQHPKRCVYLLGAEDHGLTREELDACHQIVSIPTCPVTNTGGSLNVASAGTIIMYDRFMKLKNKA